MAAGYLAKCAGKKAHPTKDVAMAARREMVAAGKVRLDQTSVYRCNQGPHYHIGHDYRARLTHKRGGRR